MVVFETEKFRFCSIIKKVWSVWLESDLACIEKWRHAELISHRFHCVCKSDQCALYVR
jgi:hypothetical protein